MPVKRIEIRWRDMDGFGHVNNSTYLTYLEEARDQYLTDLLGEAVHRIVIRRIEIDFVSGLTQDDDHVDVDVRLTGVGTSSLTLAETDRLDGRRPCRRHGEHGDGAYRRVPHRLGSLARRCAGRARGEHPRLSRPSGPD